LCERYSRDSDEPIDVHERDDAALRVELADLEHLLQELIDHLHGRDGADGLLRVLLFAEPRQHLLALLGRVGVPHHLAGE
jgi:hypothetical protein